MSVRVSGKGWTLSLDRIVRREPLLLFVKVAAKACRLTGRRDGAALRFRATTRGSVKNSCR